MPGAGGVAGAQPTTAAPYTDSNFTLPLHQQWQRQLQLQWYELIVLAARSLLPTE